MLRRLDAWLEHRAVILAVIIVLVGVGLILFAATGAERARRDKEIGANIELVLPKVRGGDSQVELECRMEVRRLVLAAGARTYPQNLQLIRDQYQDCVTLGTMQWDTNETNDDATREP